MSAVTPACQVKHFKQHNQKCHHAIAAEVAEVEVAVVVAVDAAEKRAARYSLLDCRVMYVTDCPPRINKNLHTPHIRSVVRTQSHIQVQEREFRNMFRLYNGFIGCILQTKRSNRSGALHASSSRRYSRGF